MSPKSHQNKEVNREVDMESFLVSDKNEIDQKTLLSFLSSTANSQKYAKSSENSNQAKF